MASYAPPTGPPPPKVPEGWKAVWNDQYKEWFYVNLHTKESTWEKPTAPAPGGASDAPPGYSNANAPHVSDSKRTLESNNPYNSSNTAPPNETDEQMARRLQQEESSRGQADSYYNSGNSSSPAPPGIQGGYPGAPTSPSGQLPPRPDSSGKRGIFGKLLGKSGGNQSPYPQHAPQGSGYPTQPQGYNQGYPPGPGGYGPGPQYGGYGGPPPQGYGGYGGYGPGPYGQPYGQPAYGGGYGQQPPRRSGLGAGGAAALGLGGGLLGGALLADAFDGGDDGGGDDGGGDGGDGGDG